MAGKTGAERIQDTLTYLEFNGKRALADSIRRSAFGRLSQIGEELSLDSWHVLPTAASVDRRRALRALLLCQRVFLEAADFDAPSSWAMRKTASLHHWGSRLEPEILKGIELYELTAASADRLSTAAEEVIDMEPQGVERQALTMTRDSASYFGNNICYGHVMAWLLKSGLVSMRWYARLWMADDRPKLTAAFGRGHVRWSPDRQPFHPALRPVPHIAKGMVVHMYCLEGTWEGHWFVSNGNGNGYGMNNQPEPDRGQARLHEITVNGQFAGFKKRLADGSCTQGVVEEFDPLLIPGRA